MVGHVMAGGAQVLAEDVLQLEPGMVAADVDAHAEILAEGGTARVAHPQSKIGPWVRLRLSS